MRHTLHAITLALMLVACTPHEKTQDHAAIEAAAHAAHEAYVNAINTNSTDAVAAVLTDDIVYLSPHEPVVVGKEAVRAWLNAYFGAYNTQWVKTSDEFVVAGDWAFERYTYHSTDTPKDGGAALTDTGKGINIYHHDADGVWRVARDAWNSDAPLPQTPTPPAQIP